MNHSAYGTNAKALLVGDGAASLVFDRNTIIHTNSSVLYAYGAAMPGLVYTNNLSQHHRYGIMGDGASPGKPTIAKYFPGGVVQCNVLAGGNASLYPTPNAFPTVAEWSAAFVDPAAGDYRVVAGSVLSKSGCSGAIPGADLAALAAAMGGTPAADPPPIEPANESTPDRRCRRALHGVGRRAHLGGRNRVSRSGWCGARLPVVVGRRGPGACGRSAGRRDSRNRVEKVHDQRCRRGGDAAEPRQGRGKT